MRLIISSDVEKWVALYLKDKLNAQRTKKEAFVCGLPTGSTPLKVYNHLVNYYRKQQVSFHKCITFNMDEYVGLAVDDVNSYHYYMKHNFFNHIDISTENINVLNGLAGDLKKECLEYENKIKNVGGCDIWLCGVGKNGHIAFNEPYSSLYSRTRDKDLDPQTILDNAQFFNNDIEQVPKKALTIGIKTIMDAEQVIVMATGYGKASAIRSVIERAVSHVYPISILQMHSNVLIVINEDAANKLSLGVYKYFKHMCDEYSIYEDTILREIGVS